MDDNKPAENVEPVEFDVSSLANSLLGKEEDKKEDENKSEDQAESEAEKDVEDVKATEEDEPEDNKPADDKPADDKAEGESAKEDKQPLTREDVRAAMREEAEERAAANNQRTSFAGKVRDDLKEALKLESTYTTVALDDGTPITSVSQLTQVINPETDEPYTREEASTLLLDAQRIVQENIASYEKRVDELTDINVSFKEEADRVDELYGDILKAFPDVAKDLLEAYQKTFKTSDDGSYVTEVPLSPLAFYGPALRPYRNATDQVVQQEAEAKAAEEKAVKEAEIKAEQEDRGDLGGTAGSAQGKPDLLGDALTNYLKNN